MRRKERLGAVMGRIYGRRCVIYIAILLLCFSTGACSRQDIAKLADKENKQAVMKKQKPVTTPVTGQSDDNSNSNQISKDREVDETIKEPGKMDQKEERKEHSNVDDSVKLADLLHKTVDKSAIREILNAYPSGTTMNLTGMKPHEDAKLFYASEITEDVKKRMNGKSYGANCDVPYSVLRYLRVLYYGFDANMHIGELIVNETIAEDILDIFRKLYEANYPIERMVLVDEYNADDIASMSANNTSAFNFRYVEGTKRISLHSYGMAIDINPFYNPYLKDVNDISSVSPPDAMEYVDRSKENQYYIKAGDLCYDLFIKHGFTWGGDWQSSKDYQHFQKSLN